MARETTYIFGKGEVRVGLVVRGLGGQLFLAVGKTAEEAHKMIEILCASDGSLEDLDSLEGYRSGKGISSLKEIMSLVNCALNKAQYLGLDLVIAEPLDECRDAAYRWLLKRGWVKVVAGKDYDNVMYAFIINPEKFIKGNGKTYFQKVYNFYGEEIVDPRWIEERN